MKPGGVMGALKVCRAEGDEDGLGLGAEAGRA